MSWPKTILITAAFFGVMFLLAWLTQRYGGPTPPCSPAGHWC